MLFNTSVIPEPRKSETTLEALEYPAIIVNGGAGVADAYKTLNKTEGRVVEISSATADGFDNTVLFEQFDKLIAVRRLGLGAGDTNPVLFDVPLFEDLGITMTEEYIHLDDSNLDIMYQTFIPDSASTADGTVPLVLAFHGGSDTAEFITTLSGWPELSSKEGIIVVSVDQHLSISDRSLEDSARNHFRDNIKILDKVLADYPQIDETRVYATGFSRGSVKSFDLGFNYTRRFAGILPNHCMTGNSTLEKVLDKENLNYKIPVYYMDGQEDPTSAIFVNGTTSTDIS
jgi:predicted esterase